MNADDKPCARCGGETPTYNFEQDSTFWGSFTRTTTTTTERTIRLRAVYFRRNPKHGSSVLKTDEGSPLCSDCWGLLVGRFLQGRAIPALSAKGADQ